MGSAFRQPAPIPRDFVHSLASCVQKVLPLALGAFWIQLVGHLHFLCVDYDIYQMIFSMWEKLCFCSDSLSRARRGSHDHCCEDV